MLCLQSSRSVLLIEMVMNVPRDTIGKHAQKKTQITYFVLICSCELDELRKLIENSGLLVKVITNICFREMQDTNIWLN